MVGFGYPELTQAFLDNQDVFYSQFNDIEFYVEDTQQENLYFQILKKLFTDVKLNKIFPLGGKGPVIEAAKLAIGNRKKIFIVDLDFDGILEQKIDLANLFYLERYSIENYLIEESSITEIIIDQRPQTPVDYIHDNLNLVNYFEHAINLFSYLTKAFLVIQKHELGIRNVDYDPSYFCDFQTTPPQIKQDVFSIYKSQINDSLIALDNTFNLDDKVIDFQEWFDSENLSKCHIPGKYLLKLLKHRIEHIFGLASITLESFIYRLSKYCLLNDLNYLKVNISQYLSG